MDINNAVAKKFYSYRKAIPTDCYLDFDRNQYNDLEYRLSKSLGVDMDNHTVFEVDIDGQTWFLWFHDWIIRVSRGIKTDRF